MQYTEEKDTIAAIATPLGQGGISIVRASGIDAVRLSKSMFKGSKDPEMPDRTLVYGHITDSGEIIDEVLMCVMKSPNSYTGEDVVETHCHGGHAAAGAILELLLEKGARLAEPGEFTKRGFLNGKFDLVRAESVMEIVSAESPEHLRMAERLMDGTFSKRIEELLDDLHRSISLFEVNIDFLQHGPDAIQKKELKDSVIRTVKTLDTMIISYDTAKRVKGGLLVAITGKVNAGKSSLFNTLLGRKRAIVNTRPGTTRDWLEERIEIDGLPINLIDTAGLRETDDDIEREGVSESERFIRDADIIVSLIEALDPESSTGIYKKTENVIYVLSKSDLLSDKHDNSERLHVSSKTGEGLDKLSDSLAIKARSILETSTVDPIVIVQRHRRELQHAKEALSRALDSIDTWSEEITAFELREAEKHIEAIPGRNIATDVLDAIFKNFCIGK
ncbi:MAG: tRNA uridine-5-carboxymethylaminomethyl(34) synthesis GTPase MnmE [Candidatus Latescibacteria bacterium]|jgi:tRNA modification GTPase|nr:tRNA uridine-5-carboxymethylaminomethyl(34) synthesis GTPase MnmE [Candidatus Latescibacterota bacterium]